MRTSILLIPGLALVASLPACSHEPDDLRAVLAAPQTFVIEPGESEVGIGVERAQLDSEPQSAFVEMPLVDGSVIVVAQSDQLVLTGFALTFEPVELPSDLEQREAQLVDIRVQLPAMQPCTRTNWSDDGTSATCTFSVDLTVDWTLQVDDEAWPLGPITLPGIPLKVDVSEKEDELQVYLETKVDGEVWSWLDVLRFSDLALALNGYVP